VTEAGHQAPKWSRRTRFPFLPADFSTARSIFAGCRCAQQQQTFRTVAQSAAPDKQDRKGAVLRRRAAATLHAAPPPAAFETKAKHAILMDADADLVLFEKDADTLAPPASMSKLMTLAIMFRELKAGQPRTSSR
jgi:D-alanyl-D-alanine carboxypeptidase